MAAANSSSPSRPVSTINSQSTTQYTPSTTTTQQSNAFTFPTYTHFPPFYTLQPNLTTRARQLDLWSSLITTYCAHNRIFRLSLSSLPSDLFANIAINRSLKQSDIRLVLDYMSATDNGGRIEYLPPTAKGEQSNSVYVWWRTAAEWADALYGWVDESGQKGTVFTIYELREGDAVRGKEWKEMDEGMLRRVLQVLVKRGKAQIFGQAEGEGVKIF